jgi:hypothetical protein
LLAVADGHTPTLSAKLVDPTAGPATFKLKRHDLDTRDPALVFHGRVLDEKGNPVLDAVVEPYGFRKGDGAQFGGLEGFDELALTNEKGEFRLGVPVKGLGLYVQVSARFLARRNFQNRSVDRTHDLTVVSGVTVTGRLVKDGKPLPGAAVGLVQQDRNTETFVGEYRAATDAKGVFRIPNVPPEDVFVIYGLMDSLKSDGAVPAQPLRTGATATEFDAGDLSVKEAYRLTGRVVLSDGKAVPAGTRILVSRDEAWDSQQAVVAKDGTFSLTGIPAERVNLSVNVPGYFVSPKNASYELLNGFGLCGKISANIDNLRLLLEAGQRPNRPGNFDNKLYDEYKRRRDAPLEGAPD